MKKLTSIAGITLLIALLVVPAALWAHGWGMGGGHMMGYWGRGPGDDDRSGGGYATLNTEQQERLTALDRKFYNETRELRDKLGTKSAELDALLSETTIDSGKASKLQKEISDLSARLDQKVIDYQIEARKIAPDIRLGGGYGDGHMMRGNGYGHMMGGYGRGYHHMGYGPGACWR